MEIRAAPVDVEGIARLITARPSDGVLIVGLTGSVAAGKTTLTEALIAALRAARTAEAVSTDGFLFSNAELELRGLSLRKGFPESYDVAAMSAALGAVRNGGADFPGYSHVTYDVDPALARRIGRPDVLIVEGLGLLEAAGALDLFIYLDADEADLETWFVRRFMQFWRGGLTDPTSFYARFSGMSEAEAEAFARGYVWGQINLPNLREHIVLARDRADLVLKKDAEHRLSLVRGARA